MPKLITEGAQMKCSLGSTSSSLSVTSQSFKKIDNALIATESDNNGVVNIPAFGNCKRVWYSPACTPTPQNWLKTTQKDAVNGNKKLTKDSYCMCSFGGKIEFIDTGKNTFVEGE